MFRQNDENRFTVLDSQPHYAIYSLKKLTHIVEIKAIMKKILTILSISFILAACSSGSSVSETPPNLTGTWTGTFSNSDGTDSGDITLNLNQVVDSLTVTGIALISGSDCIASGSVEGTVNSFSASLNVNSRTDPPSIMQLQLTVSGSTMSGNYITNEGGTGTGGILPSCSPGSGSGTIQISL